MKKGMPEKMSVRDALLASDFAMELGATEDDLKKAFEGTEIVEQPYDSAIKDLVVRLYKNEPNTGKIADLLEAVLGGMLFKRGIQFGTKREREVLVIGMLID